MFTDWEISHLHITPPHPGSISDLKDKEVPWITPSPANHFSSCFILSCWVDQWDNFLLSVDYQHHCKPKRQVVISHWINLCLSPWDYLVVQALPSLTISVSPKLLAFELSINNAAQCLYLLWLVIELPGSFVWTSCSSYSADTETEIPSMTFLYICGWWIKCLHFS